MDSAQTLAVVKNPVASDVDKSTTQMDSAQSPVDTKNPVASDVDKSTTQNVKYCVVCKCILERSRIRLCDVDGEPLCDLCLTAYKRYNLPVYETTNDMGVRRRRGFSRISPTRKQHQLLTDGVGRSGRSGALSKAHEQTFSGI